MIKKIQKKQSYIKKVLGIIVIIFISTFLITFEFLGYKYYYKAAQSIESASEENQNFGKSMFYGDGNNKNSYKGTLAFITKFDKNTPVIWIWGKNGLRYFKIDSNTIFSNYKICQGEEWKTGKGSVIRNSNVNTDDWFNNVKQGDFVGINIDGVFSYDWWIFKPYSLSELIQTCQKR